MEEWTSMANCNIMESRSGVLARSQGNWYRWRSAIVAKRLAINQNDILWATS